MRKCSEATAPFSNLYRANIELLPAVKVFQFSTPWTACQPDVCVTNTQPARKNRVNYIPRGSPPATPSGSDGEATTRCACPCVPVFRCRGEARCQVNIEVFLLRRLTGSPRSEELTGSGRSVRTDDEDMEMYRVVM